jgi:uncharacterized protein (DUF427 family)
MPTLPQENVQDYPRPPALEPVAEEIVVMFAGAEIVRTTGSFRVLETHHAPTYYIPPGDIHAALRPAPGRSLCEWKGQAVYFDVVCGKDAAARAAWSYPRPTRAFSGIAGYVAIYAGRMDACFVGDVQVMPQPGEFYGGWVTPNLEGIVKGGPGTKGW